MPQQHRVGNLNEDTLIDGLSFVTERLIVSDWVERKVLRSGIYYARALVMKENTPDGNTPQKQ